MPPETPKTDERPGPAPVIFEAESLLLELQDERLRNRHREAVFLSVIFHLCILILILLNPKFPLPSWLQQSHPVLLSPQQELQNQQLTYLEVPPNLPKPKHKVQSNVISNRDLEVHRHRPVLDSLNAPPPSPNPRGLREPAPPRPPAPSSPPLVAKNAVSPPKPAPAAAPPDQQKAQNGLQLQDVPQPNPSRLQLPTALSAASQLQHAIDEAAQEHATTGQSAAEVGQLPVPPMGQTGPGGRGQAGNAVQILTDTEGVDFAPYLQRIVNIVRMNWYAVMPEMAYLGRKGRVVVIFKIQRNGSVPGLTLISASGTQSFDQAALASINASNPFPPLPSAFHGPQITLEFFFYYNLVPPQGGGQ